MSEDPNRPGHPENEDAMWVTSDGVKIVDGLHVLDYDRNNAIVDVAGTPWAHAENEFHRYWDGWFNMKTPEGRRSTQMNGVRMQALPRIPTHTERTIDWLFGRSDTE